MQLTLEQKNEIDGLKQEKGVIRPEDIVERAKDVDSTLHPIIYAETDAEAAYQHRLQLARGIIQAYIVFIDDPDAGRIVEARGFISTPTIRKALGGRSGYADVGDVLGNRSWLVSVVDECLRGARSMLTRFGAFPDVRPSIEAFIHDLERTRARLEARRTRPRHDNDRPDPHPRL